MDLMFLQDQIKGWGCGVGCYYPLEGVGYGGGGVQGRVKVIYDGQGRILCLCQGQKYCSQSPKLKFTHFDTTQKNKINMPDRSSKFKKNLMLMQIYYIICVTRNSVKKI